MEATPTHSECACWEVEQLPVRIEYAPHILEEIAAQAVAGLDRFRHAGAETGGVLFGRFEPETVRILAWRELDCEYAFGPRFVLSDRDRAALRSLIDSAATDPELAGLEAVGWYHSHTRTGIALSPRDLEIYSRYLPHWRQIALLLRPSGEGPVRAGFFGRDLDGGVYPNRSYREFWIEPRISPLLPLVEAAPELEPVGEEPVEQAPPLDPSPEAAPEPDPVSEEPVAPEPAPQPEPVEAAPVEEPTEPAEDLFPGWKPEPASQGAPLPSFARSAPESRGKWLWIALPAALLIAATIGVGRYYSVTAPPPPLSLWVADVGGQLLIEWDRAARPVRNASHGTLEIVDGGEKVEIQMDAERLREGSVDYTRRSEMVDVRLRIEQPGAAAAQELIRFIGPPVRRPSGDDETARQLEQLRGEVDRLRRENERKDALIRQLRGRPGT